MTDPTPLQRALADVRYRLGNQSRENQVIAEMWAYHEDLQRQGRLFAEAKTEYGRRLAQTVITERANGERSSTVAVYKAETEDAVYRAHLAYRVAEQAVTADREALRILAAELDKIRTEKADARAADAFQTRT